MLWDAGANVGTYAVYAARFRRCRELVFEPEVQSLALLVDDIALSSVGDRCFPMCPALSSHAELGSLDVRCITRGTQRKKTRSRGSSSCNSARTSASSVWSGAPRRTASARAKAARVPSSRASRSARAAARRGST